MGDATDGGGRMDSRLTISGDLAVKLAIAAGLGLALWYLASRAKGALTAPLQAAADALAGAWESVKESAAAGATAGTQAASNVQVFTPGGAVSAGVDFVSWELDWLRRHLPADAGGVQISDIQGA